MLVLLALLEPSWHASHQLLQKGMLLPWASKGVRRQELRHPLLEGNLGKDLAPGVQGLPYDPLSGVPSKASWDYRP